MHNSF